MVKTKRKYSKRQNKKNKSRKMKRKSNRKKSINNKKGGFIETLSGIGTTYIVPIAGRILSIAFLAFLSMYFKGKISQTNETLKQPEYVTAAEKLQNEKRKEKLEGTSKSSMLKDKLGSLSIPKPNMPQLGQQSLPEVQGEVLQEVQGQVLQAVQGQVLPEVQGQVVEQPQEQPTPGANDAIVGNIQENLEAAKNAADSGEPVTPPPYVPPGAQATTKSSPTGAQGTTKSPPTGAQGTTKSPPTGAQMAAKERNETGLDFTKTTALQKKAQKAKEKTAEKAVKKEKEKEKKEVGEKKQEIKKENAKNKNKNKLEAKKIREVNSGKKAAGKLKKKKK